MAQIPTGDVSSSQELGGDAVLPRAVVPEAAAMAPLAGAEKTAVEGFFASRRGTRQLLADPRDKLAAYVTGRGITLRELPTRPSDATDVDDWKEDWRQLASAAGVTDTYDLTCVGKWIAQADTVVAATGHPPTATTTDDDDKLYLLVNIVI